MNAFVHADDLGPAKIIHVYEPGCGLKATLVVDNAARGPAIGGMRMASGVTTEECFRLVRAMTLKNAMAGLAHGGGKSVVRADPRMAIDRKEHLIRAFAHALRHESDYIFGPDMGTDETCMAWVHDEIGRSAGLPEALGGIPLDELGATGWGLASAAQAAAPHCGFALAGARVAIQGFGAVGKHAGAREIVDPRPHAVPRIARVLRIFHIWVQCFRQSVTTLINWMPCVTPSTPCLRISWSVQRRSI